MVEDVLNSLKTLLTLHLTDELVRQDAKYADDVTLVPMAQIVLGDDTPNEQGWPAIMMRCDGSETAHWCSNKKDVSYKIFCGVIVDDTDESRSQRRLWRTMRAVENVFEIHASGYDGMISYQTNDMDYTASVFGIDESKNTLKAGVITATVMKRLDAYVATQV